MIEFHCPQCRKPFSVPDAYAGRRARCKGCGGEITVPGAATVPMPSVPGSSAAPRSPRIRRLLADAEQIRSAFADCEHIRVSPSAGEPPDAYEVEYRIAGLAPGPRGKPVPAGVHRVRVQLPSDYPRLSPACTMLTPVFHPNIDDSTICVGDHWTAGERLADLIVRIGEMLAYQAYNIRSPLNGEAAMWADLNPSRLPIDARDLRPAAFDEIAPAARPSASPAA